MNVKKTPIKLLLPLLCSILISGCSSDPYASGGSCPTPGVYKKIDNKLAVCNGLNGQYKFYFEGPYFDAIYLLGKSEYDILNFDFDTINPFQKAANERGYEELTWRTDWDITNEEIASFAQGDSRWDDLIEANSMVIKLKSEFSSAQAYRFEMINDYRAGKVSQQIAYEAQQDAMKIAAERDEAMQIFSAKLAVLRAEIKSFYKITDSIEPMLFVIAKQHNL